MRVDGESAGRFAEDGDVVRIASERGDVVLDPLQREILIEVAVVAGGMLWRFGGQFRYGEQTEDAQAIVEGNQDQAVASEGVTIVASLRACADGERAAVDPDHYRQFAGAFRSPDVESKAIFAWTGIKEEHALHRYCLHA